MAWAPQYKKQPKMQADAQNYAQEILKDLVAIDTTSSVSDPSVAKSSLPGSEYVAKYLKNFAGAEIIWGPEVEEPASSGKLHKPMLAVWRPKGGKQSPLKDPLIFSGHIDTVPAEKDTWPGGKPHELHEDGDKLVGRGTIDMKGAVAAMIAQMRARFESGDLESLNRPVMIALSYGEETALKGAQPMCDLLESQGVKSGEFVIMEASDGHVLNGTKGGIQDKIDFKATLPPIKHGDLSEQYPHYLDITIESPGGHSSFKGGAPTDPARAATLVLSYVKAMREHGIPAEVLSIDYGIAPNRVGGALKLKMGYKAPENMAADGNNFALIQQIPQELEQWLGGEESKANRPGFMKTIRNALNFDAGKLKITVKQPETLSDAEIRQWNQQEDVNSCAGNDGRPTYPITLSSEKGKMECHNAAEQLLSTLDKMYEIHDRQKKNGAPAGFLMENVLGMGRTKVSGTMIQAADQEKATLYYDIRYPLEASQFADEAKTPKKTIENADALNTEILTYANSDPFVSATHTIVSQFKPSRVTPKDDPRIREYQEISTQAKLNSQGRRPRVSIASYGSDGNVISRHFKDSFAIDFAPGNYESLPHGEGEFITKRQLAASTDAVGLILERRAGATSKVKTAPQV